MSDIELMKLKSETIGHVIYCYGDLSNMDSLISNYLRVLDNDKKSEEK